MKYNDQPRVTKSRGISLLEVMIASTILVGSVMVLSQLSSIARRHLENAAQLSKAQILCQNKLTEVITAIEDRESADGQIFASHPKWAYSKRITPIGPGSLHSVVITVYESTHARLPTHNVRDGHKRRRKYSLFRWVRLPQPRQLFEETSIKTPAL